MAAEWVDIELDGVEAQRVTDPGLPGVVIVRSVTLDLYLEIVGGDRDPELIDALLDSIRERD